MLANRSIPRSTVIPELAYQDIGEAIDWLSRAFGFTLRLRIGNHRAQLNVGDGAVVLTERHLDDGEDSPSRSSVLVRVEDVNRCHDRARQQGARILRPPADYPYGERNSPQKTSPGTAGRSPNPSRTSLRRNGVGRLGRSKDPSFPAHPR